MKKTKFLLVAMEILPEAIRKTAEVKELLSKKPELTVNEAVEKVGISRSAFYKYKDGVFPFYHKASGKIITLSLNLEHRAGVLSKVLNFIAQYQGNVLTINQNLPLGGIANVTLSIETDEMMVTIDELLEALGQMDGVNKVELVGQS
ncbi:ACT domain-containing protein [Carboxydothermus pertinax]|uniref:UPF0735 ACT domain-containing protein cpu_07970 n=1 Tax=Carboxydothermus pertinax TaxID=870242 RepID=A0A1L8CTQ9_9THEO|nr:ACT domain-containing protein [Carboxydothermus pertinax]GAV22287.1 hypothetical protein cpu_07970 [Carboxydothermus pertinax]